MKKYCEKCGEELTRQEIESCTEPPAETRFICDTCWTYELDADIEPETFSDADPGL